MKDILQEIVANKRRELVGQKQRVSPSKLYAQVERIMQGPDTQRSMSQALLRSDSGIIAEFKRRSPSKGWIKEDGKAEEIPLSYAQNGAAALSVLTDEKFFGGCLKDLCIARPLVPQTPILRKDFIVDEYQLFQARYSGASAALLITSALKKDECRRVEGIETGDVYGTDGVKREIQEEESMG